MSASFFARNKAKEIKTVLNECTGQLPTIDMLAHKVGLNRVTLQSAFQELYSISIAEYGKQVKLQRIKILLANSEQTLDTIAETIGYNGAAALSRFFKQMEGVSPGVWRRTR